MKRRQKAGFLTPRSSKITVTKEKERKRERARRREKAMAALLVFIMATLGIVFGREQLLDPKGPFGGNVIKNPARYRK